MIALTLSSTDFDLVMDDVVVDRDPSGATQTVGAPPLSLGHDAQWVLTVSPTLLLSELRQTIALYTDIPATDQSIQHGAHTLQNDAECRDHLNFQGLASHKCSLRSLGHSTIRVAISHVILLMSFE